MVTDGREPDGFVIDSLARLSARARSFLSTSARRIEYDRGLTGADLVERIVDVHGSPDDDVVDLLERTQRRYGGLQFSSGYFANTVEFTPICDPEDGEPLVIDYAVSSGTSAGALLDRNGRVEVGWDADGLIEFDSLDRLIEWDAAYAAAEQSPSFRTLRTDLATFDASVASLIAAIPGARRLDEVAGDHTWGIEGPEVVILANAIWASLGLPLGPVVYVGGTDEAVATATRAMA
jgi:hypothetical protein